MGEMYGNLLMPIATWLPKSAVAFINREVGKRFPSSTCMNMQVT